MQSIFFLSYYDIASFCYFTTPAINVGCIYGQWALVQFGKNLHFSAVNFLFILIIIKWLIIKSYICKIDIMTDCLIISSFKCLFEETFNFIFFTLFFILWLATAFTSCSSTHITTAISILKYHLSFTLWNHLFISFSHFIFIDSIQSFS